MKTQLDKKTNEREELMYNVDKLLSASDIRQVKVFIAGIEVGKTIKEEQPVQIS